MVAINIKGGTPAGGESLCVSCEWGHVVKGFRTSDEATFCRKMYPDQRIPFAVSSWNGYSNKNMPSMGGMEKIAWILVTKGAGRPIGFVTPHRYQEIEAEAAKSNAAGT